MAKFIVHGDLELYTTHGAVPMNVIYDTYNKKQLTSDFKIAGFFNREERCSEVKSIYKLTCDVGYKISVKAVGLTTTYMFVYPEQKFYTAKGEIVDVSNIKESCLLLSLNGELETTLLGEIERDEDFYIIEFKEPLPTIYVNNLIIFPVMEVEKDNPFFADY